MDRQILTQNTAPYTVFGAQTDLIWVWEGMKVCYKTAFQKQVVYTAQLRQYYDVRRKLQ